jgi:hypothetical protein
MVAATAYGGIGAIRNALVLALSRVSSAVEQRFCKSVSVIPALPLPYHFLLFCWSFRTLFRIAIPANPGRYSRVRWEFGWEIPQNIYLMGPTNQRF